MSDGLEELEQRVLILAPTMRDAATCRNVLAADGIQCLVCRSIKEICTEAVRGAAAAVVTAEAVVGDKDQCLTEFLRNQPHWSDFPLIVLTPPGNDSARLLQALAAVGHTTLMKRPIQVSTFVSTIQTALRDRERQYAVRGHLAALREATDALKDADHRKDDFIALLAHELRNPLAPLRNGLQVMRLAGGQSTAVAQARAMMDRQLDHMVRLIDDLLDISRISRNKMDLRRSKVLLADIVSNAIDTARPVIESEGHQLIVTLPEEPIFLDADLTRLAQVFSNLLSNSAKYTNRGGHIWLSAALDGHEVTVTVRDDGIGIPANALPKIFDMFSQVDRSTQRSTGGLGIGLALVKGLVEMHGGTVDVVSQGDGKGSTFSVRLPILHDFAEEPTDIPFAGSFSPLLPKRRILAVDDNRDSATSLALMLKLLGNEVATAHDGLEAVTVAERFHPEVVLMDLGMPRLNGLEATRRIREQPWGKSMVVIALTGWGQDSDKQRSREAGCDGHLVKPVNLSDLHKLLSDLQTSTGSCRTNGNAM